MKKILCISLLLIGALAVSGDDSEEVAAGSQLIADPTEAAAIPQEENAQEPQEENEQGPQESENSEVSGEQVPPEPQSESEAESSADSDEGTTTEPIPTTPSWQNADSCIGECPEVDTWDSVYLPNERCDKFCQCSNGDAYVLSCPPPLQFNPKLNVCDWAQAANCTGIGGIILPPATPESVAV